MGKFLRADVRPTGTSEGLLREDFSFFFWLQTSSFAKSLTLLFLPSSFAPAVVERKEMTTGKPSLGRILTSQWGASAEHQK